MGCRTVDAVPVDEHRARTADTQSATEPGALEAEVVAQHVQQCGVIVGVNLPRVAVHMNLCHESSITAPADNRQQGTSHPTAPDSLDSCCEIAKMRTTMARTRSVWLVLCRLTVSYLATWTRWHGEHRQSRYPNWPLGPELGEEG